MTPPESDTPSDKEIEELRIYYRNGAMEAFRKAEATVAGIERELAARKGYRLVPVEPTEAMLQALENAPSNVIENEGWRNYQRRAWVEILAAAAPSATNEEGKDAA